MAPYARELFSPLQISSTKPAAKGSRAFGPPSDHGRTGALVLAGPGRRRARKRTGLNTAWPRVRNSPAGGMIGASEKRRNDMANCCGAMGCGGWESGLRGSR